MEYPIERLRTLARENGIKGKQVLMMSKLQLTKAIIDAGYTGNNDDPQPAPALETIEVPSGNVSGNGNGKQTVNPPPHVGGGLEALIAAAIAPYLDNAMAGKTDEARVAEIANDIVEETLIREDYISTERAQNLVSKAIEGVSDIIKAELSKINVPKTIEVKNLETGTTQNLGLQHKDFEALLLRARMRKNVWLAGPAGGGKTHVCGAIAKAMGISFYPQSVGAQTTESKLVGFVAANGQYSETPLYKAYKFGGFYLLDEADAGNANILTVLNALLSSGHYTFPNGELVEKHPDFVCFAAANTFGRGADRLYVGRNQLDAATLDRFLVRDFDYDQDLERNLALAINPNASEWIDLVQRWRKSAWDKKERLVISPRASIHGAEMLLYGCSIDEAAQETIWKGAPQDIIRKIKGE